MASPAQVAAGLDDDDYRRLAAFRHALRRFMAFSENEARRVGLTPQQHQALLSLRGLPNGQKPTVGALADHLMIRPHSALGLVGRLVEAGLIVRESDPDDRRIVLLRLTATAAAALESLSAAHLEELRRNARLGDLLAELVLQGRSQE